MEANAAVEQFRDIFDLVSQSSRVSRLYLLYIVYVLHDSQCGLRLWANSES